MTRLTLSEHHAAQAEAERFADAVESALDAKARARQLMRRNDALIDLVCADLAGGRHV